MQVLERRLNHPEWPLPNLIVVDGGKAQINLASGVLRERGLAIPVVGVVKDERHKARELLGPAELVKNHREAIIRLNAEAHRFAIKYHRKLRDRLSGL
jgi:excinuclease ABC subunit C